MESIELCARLSRLVRADPDHNHDQTQQQQTSANKASDVRAALEAVVAFYGDAAPSAVGGGVDDLVLAALQRLLLTTLTRDACDSATQERAFVALVLLTRRCEDRLAATRIVELLQASVLYLPTPAAAIDPTTAASGVVQTKTPPEELTLSVLQALHTLLAAPAAKRAVQQLTRSQDATHFLAYVVSSLLQLAERARNRSLALLSVHVLHQVLACVAAVDAPHVLRMFFPGVSVGLWKTMRAPLQASKVVVAALECLAFALPATLRGANDRTVDAAPPLYSLERLRHLQHSAPSVTTDTWLVQAAEKVDVLLAHILSSSAMDRQPWRVRLALVDLCGAVVRDCRASLSATFFRCFEELMVLSTHAIAEVAQAAQKTLGRLTQELPLDEWLSLEPQFAERFAMQLSTLELQCGTEQETVIAHTMEVLIGYLQFQKQQQRVQSVAVDDAMRAIVTALAHVMAFSGFDIDLLRHERQDALVVPYFQKRFRHFHDGATVAVAMRLLHNLGAVATPTVVVDTAVTLLQTEHRDGDERVGCDAVLVVLNECLRAQIQHRGSAPDHVHLVGRVLDDLLALPLWASTRARDKNTMALLVECVGVCVELCGAAFAEFLLYALYPLVEKLGDPAIQVEQAALTTLQRIAVECDSSGGGDLHALFSNNMDYLVDALCARLEQLELYPQSPQVVEALLRHATVASLPLVDEITRSLLRAVDLYQHDGASETTTPPLLRSLQLLLKSFAAKPSDCEEAVHHASETPALTRFLIEMRAMTDPLSTESNDKPADPVMDSETHAQADMTSAMPVEYGSDEMQEDDDAAADDDKEPPPLPFQAQTVEILERCSYFVADADPMACCLVLATIEQGVRYLRVRRKELLPLIHRMWPSILHRLTVANRPILTATMQLLATLAECAGDFIGDRFVETVWPSVKALLASTADTVLPDADATRATSLTRSMLLLSTDDHSGDSVEPVVDQGNDAVPPVAARRDHRVTLETKLLNATLRCLCKVSESATTLTSLVPEITEGCALFLSPSFDASTVSLTQELLLALAALNGDEVFVAMATRAQWQPPPPPSARFPAYDGGGGTALRVGAFKQREEAKRQCRANAAAVLQQLMGQQR